MKTLRIIKEKYYLQEEISLSPSDIELAIREFLETRYPEFRAGWNIAVDYPAEAMAICSKWAGFTCSKCRSMMTTATCLSEDCRRPVCEKHEKSNKCCGCI